MHTCLRNEPSQLPERVVFAEFEWICQNFLNIKTGEWDLNVLLSNYWKDLVLVSGETYFLEVAAYVSLKRAAAGVLEGFFGQFEWEYYIYLSIKAGDLDLNKDFTV